MKELWIVCAIALALFETALVIGCTPSLDARTDDVLDYSGQLAHCRNVGREADAGDHIATYNECTAKLEGGAP